MEIKDRYKHWFLSFNRQWFGEYIFLICLADPRVYIKIELDKTFDVGDGFFIKTIEDIQWLDIQPDKQTKKRVLEDAFIFLSKEENILYMGSFDESVENLIDEF